jgi:hypothetical protein
MGLKADGIVIVRSFLGREEAIELRDLADKIYCAIEETPPTDEDLMGNYRRWLGVPMSALPAYLRQFPELGQQYERLSAFIVHKSRPFFGRGYRLIPSRSFFRRHLGAKKFVPWHIDADAADVSPFRNTFNVWIPLQKVGVGLPTLELIPGSDRVMRKLPLLDGAVASRDEAFAMSLGEPIAPELDLGDVLIFNHHVLHRTQPVENRDVQRTSCEFRFGRRTLRQVVSATARSLLPRLWSPP